MKIKVCREGETFAPAQPVIVLGIDITTPAINSLFAISKRRIVIRKWRKTKIVTLVLHHGYLEESEVGILASPFLLKAGFSLKFDATQHTNFKVTYQNA